MGKTPTPLCIAVDEDWRDRPELEALEAKGHCLHSTREPDAGSADLILSRRAHAWHDALWSSPTYLATALKAARARKKGAKKNGD